MSVLDDDRVDPRRSDRSSKALVWPNHIPQSFKLLKHDRPDPPQNLGFHRFVTFATLLNQGQPNWSLPIDLIPCSFVPLIYEFDHTNPLLIDPIIFVALEFFGCNPDPSLIFKIKDINLTRPRLIQFFQINKCFDRRPLIQPWIHHNGTYSAHRIKVTLIF